jgi:putative hydrolase of the HAD superfamily
LCALILKQVAKLADAHDRVFQPNGWQENALMAVPQAIFFDIGGVLGTNGWDHVSRKRAAAHFNLKWESLEALHDKYAEALDTGKISLQDYVEKVACAESKAFSAQEFIAFMQNESQPDQDTVKLATDISRSKKYFLATLNNESPELNDYRIDKFGLAPIFNAFFSSGYLGVRKPDAKIYEITLAVSHKTAQSCVFIDDREGNLEVPKALGMTTIKFTSADQARSALSELGVDA